MDKKPLLKITDICIEKGGRTILDIPLFQVFPQEVIAVIGPNGAGKSTLLSVLGLLEIPKKGRIFHSGTEVTRKNALEFRRRAAMVFQDALLLDGSALMNVALGLNLRGKKDESWERAMGWLQRFDIESIAEQPAHTLSGGEAQRVSLARAFVLEPEILFMDEPFSSVDVINRQNLIAVFKEIQEEQRTTTVFVTHDYREVLSLANRVIVLNQGKIEMDGTPNDLAVHPVWSSLSASR